jgi:hypothetical protein
MVTQARQRSSYRWVNALPRQFQPRNDQRAAANDLPLLECAARGAVCNELLRGFFLDFVLFEFPQRFNLNVFLCITILVILDAQWKPQFDVSRFFDPKRVSDATHLDAVTAT